MASRIETQGVVWTRGKDGRLHAILPGNTRAMVWKGWSGAMFSLDQRCGSCPDLSEEKTCNKLVEDARARAGARA